MFTPATEDYNRSISISNITNGGKWDNDNICKNLDTIANLQVKITCHVDLYLPPFLIVIGFVSNVLVIVVMRSKYFRSLSTSFYMTVNAVTDTASLLITLPVHYIFVNFQKVFDESREDHSMCAFFNLLGWGTSDLGILFTLAMTTERAIAIKYPLKAYRLCTTRRAVFVVIGLTIFELIKLSHFAFKSMVVSNTTSRLCDVSLDDSTYKFFYEEVWPWFHFTMLITAYFLVITGNVVIINSIKKSNQEKSSAGIGRKISSKESRNRQLSVMLVVDSLSLVLCTLPFGIFTILTARYSSLVPDAPGGKNLAFTSTFYLLYLNRCLNFFLYCVSGSRFRSALKAVFIPGTKHTHSSRTAAVKGQFSSTGQRPSSNISSQSTSFQTGVSNLETTNYADGISSLSESKYKTDSDHPSQNYSLQTISTATSHFQSNDTDGDPSLPISQIFDKEKDTVATQETRTKSQQRTSNILSRPKYLTYGSKRPENEHTINSSIGHNKSSNNMKIISANDPLTRRRLVISVSADTTYHGQSVNTNSNEISSISLALARCSRSEHDNQTDIIRQNAIKTYL